MIWGWIKRNIVDPVLDIGQVIIDVVVDVVSDVVSWFIDIPDMEVVEQEYSGVLVNKQSNIAKS